MNVINFIVIISINNKKNIILPRCAKTDVCDNCTRMLTEISLAVDPVHVASLELKLKLHQDEADAQKEMLKKAEVDGPAKKNDNSEWCTICTGK